MNLDFLGAEQNFTQLVGSQPEWVLDFQYNDGRVLAVDDVFFSGVLKLPDGAITGIDVTQDSSGIGRIVFRFPLLEEGVYHYELMADGEDGSRLRLAYGRLGVHRTSLQLSDSLLGEYEDALESERRLVVVRLPQGMAERCVLAWRGASAASLAAEEALEAAKRAEEAARKLDGVDDTLAQLDAQVQEFRGFVATWKDEAASLLVMNPVTGTIWVGNTDTGQPYRGEDGKAPRVNARGFWEVFRDGRWVELEVQAFGRDGIDGTAFRFILVDSYEDIPQSGETCNGGFRYLVKHEGWAAVGEPASTGNGEWEAWEMPSYLLPSEFTHLRVPGALNANSTPVYLMVRTTGGEVLGVSQNAVTWAVGDVVTWEFAEPVRVPNGAVVQMFLRTTNEGLTGVVPNEEVRMMSLLAYEGVCRLRYRSNWHGGRTPYLLAWGAGASEFYDEYAWVERDGSAGWVRLPRVGELATAQVYGAMMYGTDMRVVNGAPVGRDASGRAHVPLASSTVPGAALASSAEVSNEGGGIHVSLSGSLLSDVATVGRFGSVKLSRATVITSGAPVGVNSSGQLMLGRATVWDWGAVRAGTSVPQSHFMPWIIPIGVAADGVRNEYGQDITGQLMNNLLVGGALRTYVKADWERMAPGGIDVSLLADGGNAVGLMAGDQFEQTAEDGLVLRAATTTRLAGVHLAESEGDSRGTAVPSVQQVKAWHPRRNEVYSKGDADEKFMRRSGTTHTVVTCTPDEMAAIAAAGRDKNTLYIVANRRGQV